VTKSERREIDYKARMTGYVGARSEHSSPASRGINPCGLEDFSAIPDDMRNERRDIFIYVKLDQLGSG
jgi:hypothetical protein